MSPDLEAEAKRLSQTTNIDAFKRKIAINEFLTVHRSEIDSFHNYGIHCALIPTNRIDDILDRVEWDFSATHGKPGAIIHFENDEEISTYHRFGGFDEEIEPLVILRHFNGIRADYLEITEEFRHFHDLFHDKRTNEFFRIDDTGNEELIAKISEDSVHIRVKEIRQFLAIKEMHLSLQFDYREMSAASLSSLHIEDEQYRIQKDALIAWGFNYGNLGFGKTKGFSRLLGKRLVPPLPKEKSGFAGFAEEREKDCLEFIIGLNDDGDEIMHTSNPDYLSNDFGANQGHPHYLTQVDFKRSVLDKYYNQPGKFKVEDAYLRCGSLWGTYIDNHHTDKVSAWLGDLGRDLPYEEQLHWRAHNIPPAGRMSETFYRRQILAQFTSSERPEHLFKKKYNEVSVLSEKTLGWPLFLPPNAADEHHLISLRIPTTNEQKEFDELILSLTKLLIDFLNEKKIKQLTSQVDAHGINLLAAVLKDRGLEEASRQHISFMRRLQSLRSKGSAHRKGKEYQQLLEGEKIDLPDLISLFSSLLTEGIDLLEYLSDTIERGKLTAAK